MIYQRLRSLAGRILGLTVVAWVLPAAGIGLAQSQPPPRLDPAPTIEWGRWQNPIASSNRLAAAPVGVVRAAAFQPDPQTSDPPKLDAPTPPWVVPAHPLAPPAGPDSMLLVPPGASVETRTIGSGPVTIVTFPPPAPGRAAVAVPPERASAPPTVRWAAPTRREVDTLPVPERPLVPCELSLAPSTQVPMPPPAVLDPVPPAAPVVEQLLPAPVLVTPARPAPVVGEPAQPAGPPPVTLTPMPTSSAQAPATPLPMPRSTDTCRFVDAAPIKPAVADEPLIFAAVRGSTAGDADSETLRRAVENACRAAATELQVEVVGDKQVRATLTVRGQADWQALYTRVQSLPELGDQAILFRVRVRP